MIGIAIPDPDIAGALAPKWSLRVVVFDGPAFDGPAFDGPAFDGPAFNGPAFDGPAFDGPACQITEALCYSKTGPEKAIKQALL